MNHFNRITKATHDYIGRAPCGCIHAATVDCGDKDTAKTVAEYIRAGLAVERVPHKGKWRDRFGRNCEACKRPLQKELIGADDA